VDDSGGGSVSESSTSRRAWTFTYDSTSNLTSVTNPLGNATTYTYTGNHNLNKVILPQARGGAQASTTFAYYQNGKTFTYADTLGDTNTLDYDLFRMNTRVTDPRGFNYAYTGGSATYTYDPLYRLLSATYAMSANNHSFTYDYVGNRLTMTNNSGTLAYVYDADNRLNQFTQGQ
jgi:YD repeat-containing protein